MQPAYLPGIRLANFSLGRNAWGVRSDLIEKSRERGSRSVPEARSVYSSRKLIFPSKRLMRKLSRASKASRHISIKCKFHPGAGVCSQLVLSGFTDQILRPTPFGVRRVAPNRDWERRAMS